MAGTYPMAVVSAPGRITFQETPLRDPGPGEILIGVKAASICGSDLHIFRGKHPSAPLPVAVGHELAGDVLTIGDGVTRFKPGDRVVVEPVITCGHCFFCLRGQYSLCTGISFHYRKGQGAFAPYFIAPERWVHSLPENLSYEEGALIEPASVAVHAVAKARLQFGQTVAVFGAGAIGLLVLLLSRLAGAGDIFVVDVQEPRLKKAEVLGATEGISNREGKAIEQIFGRTAGLGVDTSFEAVGLEATLVQALSSLKKGGTAILIGIFEKPDAVIPANLFIQREISLVGSQGYCWDFQKALKLAGQGSLRLADLVTHTVPLTSLQEGFEIQTDPRAGAVKVVARID
jgi:2-desacetyl-2-hydroxyethyl bacteriochlorophyllide A dehydrogenase